MTEARQGMSGDSLEQLEFTTRNIMITSDDKVKVSESGQDISWELRLMEKGDYRVFIREFRGKRVTNVNFRELTAGKMYQFGGRELYMLPKGGTGDGQRTLVFVGGNAACFEKNPD